MNLDEILDSLGSSAQEVAERVPCGRKASACDCPVARYLNKHFPVHGGWVVSRSAIMNYSGDRKCKTPQPVADFILLFDGGVYPGLVEPVHFPYRRGA